VPVPSAAFGHSYYKFYAFVRPESLRKGWNRNRIMQAICAKGVPCYVGSCSEIYLERAFAGERTGDARFPIARELGETSLMFLVHPTLSEQAIHYTCRTVERVMGQATTARGSDLCQ